MKLEYLPDGPNGLGLVRLYEYVPGDENRKELHANWQLVRANKSPFRAKNGSFPWMTVG